MNQLQNKSFEEALVRYREKWDKIKDPCVVYDFPIPDVSCKELFLKRVSEHPDKTYVISRGTKMSYVDCNTLAAKIANGFLAKGLKKGDRVITYVSNGFEFVALAHACFKTGIIMVNTNPRSTADEIIRRIKDCTPKMVITDSDGADAVVQALKDDKAGVEHMVFCPALEKENRWDELGAWESIISDDASEPDISISPEDIAILQYTGGTTGVLKGCARQTTHLLPRPMAQVQYFRPFLNDNDYENYMVHNRAWNVPRIRLRPGHCGQPDYGRHDILCGKPGRDTSGDRKVSADRLAERSAVDEAYSYPRGISEIRY